MVFKRRIGELVASISLDSGPFNRDVEKSKKSIQALSGNLRSMGTVLTGLSAPFIALGVVAVKAASDLEESINAVNVVFGDASETILDFGKTAATSLGLAQADFNQLATNTGALLTNFGLSNQEAADQTTILAQRAADMASVFNTDVKDALFAVNAALRGETEPIRRYAVDVTQATLANEALALGIDKAVTEMDQEEKAALRLSSIMRQTEKTAGDFANTSDNLANQQRILRAELTDIAASLGTALVPALESVLDTLRPIITSIGDWIRENPTFAGNIIKSGLAVGALGVGLVAVSLILGPIATAIRGLRAAFILLNSTLAITIARLLIIPAALLARKAVSAQLAGIFQSTFGFGAEPDLFGPDAQKAFEENMFDPAVVLEQMKHDVETIFDDITVIIEDAMGSAEESFEGVKESAENLIGAPGGGGTGGGGNGLLGVGNAMNQIKVAANGLEPWIGVKGIIPAGLDRVALNAEFGTARMGEFVTSMHELKIELGEAAMATEDFGQAAKRFTLSELLSMKIGVESARRETSIFRDLMLFSMPEAAEAFAEGLLSSERAVILLEDAFVQMQNTLQETQQDFIDTAAIAQAAILVMTGAAGGPGSPPPTPGGGGGGGVPGVPALPPGFGDDVGAIDVGEVAADQGLVPDPGGGNTFVPASRVINVNIDGRTVASTIGSSVKRNM